MRRTLANAQLGKESVLGEADSGNGSGADETRDDGSARSR